MITGSPWDAEDLVQETLMKAMASMGQVWQPIMPKTYLFRIATNSWINDRRKHKAAFFPYDEATESLEDINESHKFEVREAIETLVFHLPPKQVAVILLMDVLDFTANGNS